MPKLWASKDNVQGQISEYIFVQKIGYCDFYPSIILQNNNNNENNCGYLSADIIYSKMPKLWASKDIVQGQISEYILVQNRGYCDFYPSIILQRSWKNFYEQLTELN